MFTSTEIYKIYEDETVCFKRRYTKFRLRGITQKKEYTKQNEFYSRHSL